LHFCSHRHTPNSGQDGGPVVVRGAHGTYVAYDAFRIYEEHGQQTLRDIVLCCIKRELGRPTVITSLPSAGRVTLMRQAAQQRDVLHLLYAVPVRRGRGVEVIEDIVPLFDIRVEIRRRRRPTRITLVPSGPELDFSYEADVLCFTVPRLECHQMVEIAD
jgi:hypothetical protein